MIAQDLRIGNYIIDEFGDEVQVSTIFPDTVVISDRGNNNVLNELIECNPIPITPEWLEKLGFINAWDNKWEYTGDEYFWIEKNEDTYYFLQDMSFWTGNGVEYIHELQNLFFGLFKTELTIKNKTS
jgi:hypothetical protein